MSGKGWWYVEIPTVCYSAQNINKITVVLLLIENRTLGCRQPLAEPRKQAQVTELNVNGEHVLSGMEQARLVPSCPQLAVSSVHELEVGMLCGCPSPSASQTESRLSNPSYFSLNPQMLCGSNMGSILFFFLI